MSKNNLDIASPILRKTVLIILGIALGGILLSSLLINFSLGTRFQEYLTKNEQSRQGQIVADLQNWYRQNGGWPSEPLLLGFGRGMFGGSLHYVTDRSGRLVLVSKPGRMQWPALNALRAIPIKVDGATVGTAYFGLNKLTSILTEQDRLFRASINRSILLAVLLTGLIALVVAFFFAQRLADPIAEMNRIAKNMALGDLKPRVSDLPANELGELGASLNLLANRLQQMETLRKKMTADVAHDLRTPLTTVRGHLEGMIDRVIPASPENLESLLEEVLRLTVLVNNLQEVSNADRALQQLHLEPLDLNRFLEDLIKTLRPLFREKGVLLQLEPTGTIGLNTDAGALRKIFDNLLYNALKFTSSGKKVLLQAKAVNGQVEITVSDEGIGIDAQDLPFVFERFYRTDQSRSRENGGFGLGLTIVKELTEALGGTVNVTSEPGRGSVFTIRLPGKE